MANNYLELSSWLDIPAGKCERAQEIIDEIALELEDDPDDSYGCLCVQAEVQCTPKPGVWFHSDESADPEHVAMVARRLIDEFEIDEPFVCSWADTCSKPRIDEFGGGAFLIKRGYETVWVDAALHVRELLENGQLVPLEE